MRLSSAIQHIQHIASLGLPSRHSIPAMVDALQMIIPSSTNCFVWLDEQGQPFDMYERHPIPEAADAFMMQTPYLEATGQPSMAKLIRGKGEFGNWWRFTAFDGWERSVMKNELFRPYNIGNNMDFLIKDKSRPMALLTVNREPFSAEFRRQEVDAVLGLRAHFTHAMRAEQCTTHMDTNVAEDDVATAIVDVQGRILSTSSSAALFLHQLNDLDCRIPMGIDKVPPSAQAVIDRLAHINTGRLSLPASDDIETPWCTLRVTAHRMNDNATIILTLQRFTPIAVLRLRNVAATKLTPAERRVAYLMCSDFEAHEIASAAGVTETSFREYSKRIRAKLDVSSRDGVRAKLSARQLA